MKTKALAKRILRQLSHDKRTLALMIIAPLFLLTLIYLVFESSYSGGGAISMFDRFASTLIGFLVFFLVFLVGGMAFLKERTNGTLERLLSTPVRRWQVILGYIIGFGLVTVIQSICISFYAVYALDVAMEGSMVYVLLITLLSALCALTLGMLLSTVASSEFQIMQFIPILILPQLFFSGLFELSDGWMTFGKFFPLYYITDALNGIMFNGDGLDEIGVDVLILIGYSMVFVTANIILLKKYRKI